MMIHLVSKVIDLLHNLAHKVHGIKEINLDYVTQPSSQPLPSHPDLA